MLISQFIREQYPITDRIKAANDNPINKVKMHDDLPYDLIALNSDGVMSKMLYLDDTGATISVWDLLSSTPEERARDESLNLLYDNYMQQVEEQDLEIEDLLKSAKEYRKHNEAQMRKANELLV